MNNLIWGPASPSDYSSYRTRHSHAAQLVAININTVFYLFRAPLSNMIRLLLTAGALVGIVASLQCHSCDSFLSCTQPFPVNCPPHSNCYTLTRGNQLIAKGCAHSCNSLSQVETDSLFCTICHHRDFCNAEEHGIGQGVELKHSPPGIGGGVAPNPDSYHIGHGVRPRSASQTTLGVVLALPVFRRFVF